MRIPFGKRHAEIASLWIPTASTFGGAGGLALLYFTDWKAVLRFMPFYNTKFKTEE